MIGWAREADLKCRLRQSGRYDLDPCGANGLAAGNQICNRLSRGQTFGNCRGGVTLQTHVFGLIECIYEME